MSSKIIFPVILISVCVSCKVQQEAIRREIHVDVREHTELVPYIVFTEIPEIKESVRVKDSTSHLENDYATSDASILPDGSLLHTLGTKPQRRPQSVDVPVVYKDSLVYVETEVTKEVPARLTWWQRFRLDAFWVMLLLMTGGLLLIFIRKGVLK